MEEASGNGPTGPMVPLVGWELAGEKFRACQAAASLQEASQSCGEEGQGDAGWGTLRACREDARKVNSWVAESSRGAQRQLDPSGMVAERSTVPAGGCAGLPVIPVVQQVVLSEPRASMQGVACTDQI